MKKLKLFLIAFLFTVLGLTGVNAEEVTKVTNVNELNNCINANGTCQLQNDISYDWIQIKGKTTTIDLNSFKLEPEIEVIEGSDVTIKDSKNTGKITASTGYNTLLVMGKSKLTLESGTIHSTHWSGVKVIENSTFVMNGGTVSSDEGDGVYVVDSTFTFNNGTINAVNGNNGVTLDNSTFTMKDGKITANQFGILYIKNSNVTIDSGTIESKNNIAIGDNGTKDWGGNVVNVNGGSLTSNVNEEGSISCGIYNSNDTTLTVKSGVKIIANKGGAGIVVRGGKVTVAKDVIDNMVAGGSKGKVADSNVVVSGKIVKDYESNYPAMSTINVTIDYNTVSDKEVTNTTESKQATALNNEISYIINNNKIESLKNVDLTDLSIKTVSSEVTKEVKEQTITKAKEALKDKIADYTIADAVDLKVVVFNKDTEVYNVTETKNKIPFGIDVKSIATNNKLNYEFQIIRVHTTEDGDQYEILDSTYDVKNGIVSFESDKFSTYLVSYKTTAKPASTTTNPNTSDAIAIYAGILVISTLAIGAFVLRKKHN